MVNLSLDICMENFWTRPTGVYAKPVWLREGVLQIIFDDDNTPLRYHSGSTVPGGHAAFTRTAVVYSSKPTADYSPEIADEALASEVAALKAACPAFTQRVGSCYLIEANLFGFVNAAAGESSRMEEMNVLSTAMTWAVRDYTARYGVRPDHIVLHLDVNGTLILGDVASQKSITKAANSLAKRAIERAEQGAYTLPCKVEDVERIKTLPEALVCEEFNVMCVALSPAAPHSTLCPPPLPRLSERGTAREGPLLALHPPAPCHTTGALLAGMPRRTSFERCTTAWLPSLSIHRAGPTRASLWRSARMVSRAPLPLPSCKASSKTLSDRCVSQRRRSACPSPRCAALAQHNPC